MKRHAFVFFLLSFLTVCAAGTVRAGDGIDTANPDAAVLLDASAALESVNPELAQKVYEVTKKTFPEKAKDELLD